MVEKISRRQALKNIGCIGAAAAVNWELPDFEGGNTAEASELLTAPEFDPKKLKKTIYVTPENPLTIQGTSGTLINVFKEKGVRLTSSGIYQSLDAMKLICEQTGNGEKTYAQVMPPDGAPNTTYVAEASFTTAPDVHSVEVTNVIRGYRLNWDEVRSPEPDPEYIIYGAPHPLYPNVTGYGGLPTHPEYDKINPAAHTLVDMSMLLKYVHVQELHMKDPKKPIAEIFTEANNIIPEFPIYMTPMETMWPENIPATFNPSLQKSALAARGYYIVSAIAGIERAHPGDIFTMPEITLPEDAMLGNIDDGKYNAYEVIERSTFIPNTPNTDANELLELIIAAKEKYVEKIKLCLICSVPNPDNSNDPIVIKSKIVTFLRHRPDMQVEVVPAAETEIAEAG